MFSGRQVANKFESGDVMKRFVRHSIPVLFILAACASALSADGPAAGRTRMVGGTWQMSWQARLGTESATIELRQDGSRLNGTFRDAHHSGALSGSIEGRNVTFSVSFQEARPYAIAFKGTVGGTVGGETISGTSQAQNIPGSGAYLGHGGEIVQPAHPWTASRQPNPPSLKTQEKPGTRSSSNQGAGR